MESGQFSAAIALVGYTSPGPTNLILCSCIINILARKLSNLISRLDKILFTIRPQSASTSLRAPCACDPQPWCSVAMADIEKELGISR